ncbi:MAG: nucleotide pyrophosphohydrolase [Planctomycetota bacterium]|jgi:NTP pyrophosphatase (non-canonical NTP hydrolase)
MDETESLKTFRTILGQFVSERKWEQFHAPKNISMALAIEAAELMEHFQWLTVEESRAVKQDPEKLHAIGEEIADVFCYTLALVNELNLDLGAIFEKKMARNRAKYPAAEYRGRFGKDDSRPVSDE